MRSSTVQGRKFPDKEEVRGSSPLRPTQLTHRSVDRVDTTGAGGDVLAQGIRRTLVSAIHVVRRPARTPLNFSVPDPEVGRPAGPSRRGPPGGLCRGPPAHRPARGRGGPADCGWRATVPGSRGRESGPTACTPACWTPRFGRRFRADAPPVSRADQRWGPAQCSVPLCWGRTREGLVRTAVRQARIRQRECSVRPQQRKYRGRRIALKGRGCHVRL
jgi:hypothetical protein